MVQLAAPGEKQPNEAGEMRALHSRRKRLFRHAERAWMGEKKPEAI